MNNKSVRVFALIWAALMIAVVSSTLTLLLSGRSLQPVGEGALKVSQSDYDAIQRYRRLDEVRNELMTQYYQQLDEDELLLGAIRGMTSAVGDPYTFYYTPEEMRRANENSAGVYRGVGLLLQNTPDGIIEVVRVFPDTPAEQAGIRVGDWIVAVDGEFVSGDDGRTYNDAVNRIRGENGTRVTVTVLRDGQEIDFPMNRGDVNVSYINYRVLPDDIGYISIAQFTGNAAAGFAEALEAFRAQGVKGMVIDVRNNPGGLLDQVVSIADKLLPTGEIVYIKDRNDTRMDFYSDEEMYDVPLAVLVNGMSASASEILALSVQALDRGTVVGLTTYGKGIVQSLVSYSEDGAGMQLTTSSYYDALDRCPQGVGVTPDIEVALEGAYIPVEPDPESDNQLAAAIADVKRQIGGGA
ncbi:MAG: S41 family peptidase [Clostridia bacterium]|nr:S41 family peptidase [Clostridia bacterium]